VRRCRSRNRPSLPGTGADVAAFLAAERGRGLTPETLKLRRVGIRHLHRAAGCPVPTDDVAVSETLAGISRQAARKGYTPKKKVAATAGILRQILASIPADPRRSAWPARPRAAAGGFCRGAAPLGTGTDPD
jgi:hypothetical protein